MINCCQCLSLCESRVRALFELAFAAFIWSYWYDDSGHARCGLTDRK
jgi:hypothetical protein